MKYWSFTPVTLSTAIAFAGVSEISMVQAADSFFLEEVVITAQKREQSLQDVGITISAFDGKTLEAMGVGSSNEIAVKTPNLNIVSPLGEGSVVSVFIRGIGLNDFALNNTGPVGFYIDDSSIGSSNGQLTTLFDVARVEVLKGPQGTLFGRNTTGGALNIISNKPTSEFEASGKLSAGNFGYQKFEGMVSGGLTETASGRLALVTNQSTGYMKNTNTGDTVGKKNFSGRLLLDYMPADDLSILLNIHGSRNDSDTDLYGTTADADFYEGAYGSRDYRINVDTFGASVKTGYDINDAVTLTSITAYDDLNKRQQVEGDMTPLQLVESESNVDTHTFSQELRLNGSDDQLHWITGLYYLSETINWKIAGDYADLPLIPGVLYLGDTLAVGHQELTTQAIFGQVEYDLADQWVLTVGGRYTQLEVDFDYAVDVPSFSYTPLQSSLTLSDALRNEEFSGKIALNYFAREGWMYYGSLTRGFKGGGFNGDTPSDLANYAANVEYDPELLTAYEVGLKSTLLVDTLRLNAAIFYYDYEGAQVFNSIADPNTNLPQNKIENAKALELYGLDLDLTWQPLDELYVQGGVGYTHSEFIEYDMSVPTATGLSSADLSGETPQNSPGLSVNLIANYTWFLGARGSLSAQIDGSYQSEIFYSSGTVINAGDPSSYTRNKEVGQGGYSLWNARLSWGDASGQLEVALWGKNLAGKEYASYMFELTNLIGSDQVMRGAPRIYGANIKYMY